MGFRNKIVGRAELIERLKARRERGDRVVQCDGVFDILHPGHFRHLVWAHSQGDVLVVSLRPDAVVRRSHPSVLSAASRAENAAGRVGTERRAGRARR